LYYKRLGAFTNVPIVYTTNTNALTYEAFTGGLDNSQLIAKNLNPGDCIGIFIKRTPTNILIPHDSTYYTDLYNQFVANNYGIIQNDGQEDISFCIEWDDPKQGI
jgi:hypothetical protein